MYKGRFFIRQQLWLCGDYMEISTYPVWQKAGRRRKKCRPTSAVQERLNRKNREMRLTRLIHMNFTESDIAVHLTYSDKVDQEEARRHITNFTARLKRRMAKAGLELRYILVTEAGKRSGRIHHHLIINGGLDRDEIEKLWGKGWANTKRLQFGDDGVSSLARYMVKGGVGYKAWSASRNLSKPEPVETDGGITMGDIEEQTDAIDHKRQYEYFESVYPEFELVESEYSKNSVNRGTYIYVMMKRKKSGRGNKYDTGGFNNTGPARRKRGFEMQGAGAFGQAG